LSINTLLISGASLTVSGIDILDGTPVIDIKPYIPQYDCPTFRSGSIKELERQDQIQEGQTTDNQSVECNINFQESCSKLEYNMGSRMTQHYKDNGERSSGDSVENIDWNSKKSSNIERDTLEFETNVEEVEDLMVEVPIKSNRQLDKSYENQCHQTDAGDYVNSSDVTRLTKKQKKNENDTDDLTKEGNSVNSQTTEHFNQDITAASWVKAAPVTCLKVQYTEKAEQQLRLFSSDDQKIVSDEFKLKFVKSWQEAMLAITNILQEDPRSTYRRTNCKDSLYYFTFDTMHVTCWFDDDVAQVVRIKPVCSVEKLHDKLNI